MGTACSVLPRIHHKPEPGCGTLADGLVETVAGNSIKNEGSDLSFKRLVRSSPRQQYENVSDIFIAEYDKGNINVVTY